MKNDGWALGDPSSEEEPLLLFLPRRRPPRLRTEPRGDASPARGCPRGEPPLRRSSRRCSRCASYSRGARLQGDTLPPRGERESSRRASPWSCARPLCRACSQCFSRVEPLSLPLSSTPTSDPSSAGHYLVGTTVTAFSSGLFGCATPCTGRGGRRGYPPTGSNSST